MNTKENSETYRDNNIDLATALNSTKAIMESYMREILFVRQSLKSSEISQMKLESELKKKTHENEQLKEELQIHQQKSIAWQTSVTGLIKCNTAKYMELMRMIGVLPSIGQPTAAAPTATLQHLKTESECVTNVKRTDDTKPAKESSILSERTTSNAVGKLSYEFNDMSIGSCKNSTHDQDDDLIRFSSSPSKNNFKKDDSSEKSIKYDSHSTHSISNVTFRRHTKDGSYHQEADLINQINESLELIGNMVHSSTLKSDFDNHKSQDEEDHSEESMNASVWSLMKEDIDNIKESELELTKTDGKNSSALSIMLTASPNLTNVDQRNSDKFLLRIPKELSVQNSESSSTTPKKPKRSEPLAFKTKSPRLSSSNSDSQLPANTGRVSLNSLSKIVEKSPVNTPSKNSSKSPLVSSASNRNIQNNSNLSDKPIAKSPSKLPIRKKSHKETKDAVSGKIAGKQKIANENIDPNELLYASGRPMRRAAPNDLREPLLKSKMRR